jgi:hypothetical protein
MNQVPPQQPPPTPHVCFSGSPSCSGCNPCPACLYHVRMCVLLTAMHAGNMQRPCPRCGEPNHVGVTNDEAQANAVFAGWDAGWQRLHDAMMHDSEFKKQYVATPVPGAPVIAAPTMQDALASSGLPQVAQPPQTPAPTTGGVAVDGIDLSKPLDLETVKGLLSEAEKKATPGSAVVQEVANPRTRNIPAPKPRVLTPEELAAAAAPIQSGPSNGGR